MLTPVYINRQRFLARIDANIPGSSISFGAVSKLMNFQWIKVWKNTRNHYISQTVPPIIQARFTIQGEENGPNLKYILQIRKDDYLNEILIGCDLLLNNRCSIDYVRNKMIIKAETQQISEQSM